MRSSEQTDPTNKAQCGDINSALDISTFKTSNASSNGHDECMRSSNDADVATLEDEGAQTMTSSGIGMYSVSVANLAKRLNRMCENDENVVSYKAAK